MLSHLTYIIFPAVNREVADVEVYGFCRVRGDGCKLSGDLQEEKEERRKFGGNFGPEGQSEGNFVHQTDAIANGESSPHVEDRTESERKRGAAHATETASAGKTTGSGISPKQRGIEDVDAEVQTQKGKVLKEALPSSNNFSAKISKESEAVDANSDRGRSLKIERPAVAVGGRRAKIVVDGATISFQAIGYEIDYEIARIVGTFVLMSDSILVCSVAAHECFLKMARIMGTFLLMYDSIVVHSVVALEYFLEMARFLGTFLLMCCCIIMLQYCINQNLILSRKSSNCGFFPPDVSYSDSLRVRYHDSIWNLVLFQEQLALWFFPS